MATHDDLDNWFTYHAPKPDQLPRYEFLREQFHTLGMHILDNTPACADQTAALRKLRECAMAVNQTIACNEGKL